MKILNQKEEVDKMQDPPPHLPLSLSLSLFLVMSSLLNFIKKAKRKIRLGSKKETFPSSSGIPKKIHSIESYDIKQPSLKVLSVRVPLTSTCNQPDP